MTLSPKIYLDYAATTPIDPMVLRAMQPYFSTNFGNAGSLHSFGQQAIAALDISRENIASSIGADFQEIIFTGSATEANNLALRGAARKSRRKKGSACPRIIVSSIEHESILETVRGLEKEGIDVIHLPVDRKGVVDLRKLETSLNKDTILVSLMYANNEIGTIQPIAEAAKIINNFRARRSRQGSASGGLLFHTDAAQAFQFFDCDVAALGVDLMTLSSHKIYGPKGAGALYVKKGTDISPTLTGGGQEFNLRSGTENIPAIVGFSKAVKIAVGSRESAGKDAAKLCHKLWEGIKKICPQAEINGVPFYRSSDINRSLRQPNILNVYFPGHDAQDLLTEFDLCGLAVSSGSACRARASLSSYVIEALGHSKTRSGSSIRFSLGRPTTKKEIERALAVIKKTIKPKR